MPHTYRIIASEGGVTFGYPAYEPSFSMPSVSQIEMTIAKELETFVLHVIEHMTTRCGEHIMISADRDVVAFFLKEDGLSGDDLGVSPSHVVSFGVDEDAALIQEAFDAAVEKAFAIVQQRII